MIPTLLFLLSFISFEKAEVLYVIDGDTIKVKYKDKKESVRLIGIDCFESRAGKKVAKQAKMNDITQKEVLRRGKLATNKMKSMIKKGDIVKLEFDVNQRDFYKRLLAYVHKDGKMLNLEMVKSGHAFPYPFKPCLRYKDKIADAYLKSFRVSLISTDVTGLEKVDEEDAQNLRKGMTKDFVFHKIPAPAGAMDMFEHEICYNTISKEYWILRTGGFAGVYEMYGPVKVKKL